MMEIDFGELAATGIAPLEIPQPSRTRTYRVLSKSLREDGLVDVDLVEEFGLDKDRRIVTLSREIADGTAERLGIGVGELVSVKWER